MSETQHDYGSGKRSDKTTLRSLSYGAILVKDQFQRKTLLMEGEMKTREQRENLSDGGNWGEDRM